MNTFEWIIVNTEVTVQNYSLSDIVIQVNWRYQGSDGVRTSSVYGATVLLPPDPNNFIPFDQLTNAQVSAWVEEDLGQEAIEGFQNQIANDLEAGSNLTVIVKELLN